MNKTELIGKLQMVYIGDRNAFNELVGYYDGLKQGIGELQQENKRLKDNWDKLRKYLKETVERDDYSPYDGYDWQDILEKMQELESGDSDEL